MAFTCLYLQNGGWDQKRRIVFTGAGAEGGGQGSKDNRCSVRTVGHDNLVGGMLAIENERKLANQGRCGRVSRASKRDVMTSTEQTKERTRGHGKIQRITMV